jgi:hypothetical protein
MHSSEKLKKVVTLGPSRTESKAYNATSVSETEGRLLKLLEDNQTYMVSTVCTTNTGGNPVLKFVDGFIEDGFIEDGFIEEGIEEGGIEDDTDDDDDDDAADGVNLVTQ